MASARREPQSSGDDHQKAPKLLSCSYKVFPDYHGESVFCRILCSKLKLRAEPSLTAMVIEEKSKGEIICIRNDNSAPDPELGWMEATPTAFVPFNVRSDLEPLSYADLEVMDYIRSTFGFQIHQAEDLILNRIQTVSRDKRYDRGQLLQVGILEYDEELKEWAGDSYCRAVACNVRSGLMVCQDASTRFIRTSRIFRKGDLIEVCRVFPLKADPGEALSPFAVQLNDGNLGMPLGYACFYPQAPNAAAATAEASLAEWPVGGGYVLLIHALQTLCIAQFPTLYGKPKEATSPWTLNEPPQPKGFARQMEKPMAQEASGLIRWGVSPLHGAGVFAMQQRPKGSVLELCPTLKLDRQSKLAATDYAVSFEAIGTLEAGVTCLSLGLGAVYNHSDRNNADYWYDRSLGTLAIIAIDDIPAGSEIFINYGEGYWKSRKDLKK